MNAHADLYNVYAVDSTVAPRICLTVEPVSLTKANQIAAKSHHKTIVVQTHAYSFDVLLQAAVTIHADSIEQAYNKLASLFDCATCTTLQDGAAISFEASFQNDTAPTLYCVDGVHLNEAAE